MRIFLTAETDVVPISPARVETILKHVARAEGFHGDLSVAIVDDRAIAVLNAQYLQKNAPTDVLAFSYGDDPDGLAGEIVVSAETAARVASSLGEPPERELLRYCVHGLLHLCGYDDRDSSDRINMEAAQERALPGKEEF